MPPRASGLTSSFSVSEQAQEVVCPLTNQDGSHCRKRCLGEKRYRSMQEHIRRAHPEYYIPKLPATRESFEMMINSPPHDPPAIDPNHANHRPSSHHANIQRQQQQHSMHQHHHSDPSGLSPAYGGFDAGLNAFEGYPSFDGHDGGYYTAGDAEAQAIYQSMQHQQRTSDELRRGSIMHTDSAALALASLRNPHSDGADWGGDHMGQVILPSMQMSPTITEADFLQNFYADQHNDMKSNYFHVDPALEDPNFMPDGGMPPMSSSSDQPGLMPSALGRSPPDRSMLPSLQRSMSRQYNRPRKSSLSQQARMPKHERKRSQEMSKRKSGDRKTFSAEPTAAQLYGKRWEDLIDAAASATEEEDSRDLTPIPASPYQSPQVPSRTSLPPFAMGSQFQSFQASPLNRALTPPPPDPGLGDLQPFASVDSSLSSNISHAHHNSADSSGSQFHIMNPNSLTTPSDTSPVFNPTTGGTNVSHERTQPVQIYCAGCGAPSKLADCFACTNCICGLCGPCTDAIVRGQATARMSHCPRCHSMDGTFKPFQLDLKA